MSQRVACMLVPDISTAHMPTEYMDEYISILDTHARISVRTNIIIMGMGE